VPRLRDILDILKDAKHSKPKPVFCPTCQSPNIKLSESYGILPQRYVCKDCGYEGNIVLELEEEEQEP
jgi:transposase-like protein